MSASLSITVDATAPSPPSTPDLAASSDTGISNTDNNTSDTTPTFTGTAEANSTVELFAGSSSYRLSVGTTQADSSGDWTFTLGSAAPEGTYSVTAKAFDAAGNADAASPNMSFTIDTSAPAAPSVPDLVAESDTGTSNSDNLTSDITPTFNGTAEASSRIELFAGSRSLGITTADSSGNWSFTVGSSSALSNGSHAITAKAIDAAGNVSSASGALTMTVDTATTTPSRPDLATNSDTGSSNSDNLTSDKTPTFTGTAEAGSTVELFVGGQSLTQVDNSFIPAKISTTTDNSSKVYLNGVYLGSTSSWGTKYVFDDFILASEWRQCSCY